MVVEIKDLRVGDEIIVPSNSQLKYLKVLRIPQLGTKLHWKTKLPLYKGIKCSGRNRIESTTYNYNAKPYVITKKIWECSHEGHNVELYENLNYKTIWLVNRQ